MKQLIGLFITINLLICLVLGKIINLSPVKAQTITKDAKPVSSSNDSTEVIDKLKQIEKLKEKIATKVAEIREKDRGGLYGTIKKIDNDTIIISNKKGETSIQFSDDSIFYNFVEGKKSESTSKKLMEGMLISALGYFDANRTSLNAKYIYFQSPIIYISGKISIIDKDNYTITVKENKGDMMIDIEKSTKTFSYNMDKDNFVKSGFSKLKIGDIVHAVGNMNTKEQDRITARTLSIFPNLNKSQTSPSPSITSAKSVSVTPQNVGKQ